SSAANRLRFTCATTALASSRVITRRCSPCSAACMAGRNTKGPARGCRSCARSSRPTADESGSNRRRAADRPSRSRFRRPPAPSIAAPTAKPAAPSPPGWKCAACTARFRGRPGKWPPGRPNEVDLNGPSRMATRTQFPPHDAASQTGPLRVLLVDDNLADRVHLAWLLRRGLGDQLEILEAEDGAGALELLRRGPVDLMLIDYLLPDMNGLDVLDRLAELHCDTATIFLTGQGSEKVAAEAIKRGAHDYCVKRDLAWDKLERTVSQSLRTVRLQRRNAEIDQQLRRTHLELDHFVRALSHDMSANFMLLDSSFRQLRRSCEPSPLAGMLDGLSHVEACLRESK